MLTSWQNDESDEVIDELLAITAGDMLEEPQPTMYNAMSTLTSLQIPDPALFPDQFRINSAVVTIAFKVSVAGAFENEAAYITTVPSNVAFSAFFGNVSLALETPARMRLALASNCRAQYPNAATWLAFQFRTHSASTGWKGLMTGVMRHIREGHYEGQLVHLEFY